MDHFHVGDLAVDPAYGHAHDDPYGSTDWKLLPSGITGPPALYYNTWLIQNEYTGKCLTLAAAQTYNGVAIVQRPCYTGGSLQLRWQHRQGY